MFIDNCLVVFFTCVCVSALNTDPEAKTEYFNKITIRVYDDEKLVTNLLETTVNDKYNATEIIIDYEDIPVLKTGTFNNLKKLKYIGLKRNCIQKIEPYAFIYLPNLRIIDLSFNYIERIPENVFCDLYLSKLYLKGNGIKYLDSFAFKNLSSLETLDLSSNNIKTLPNHLFFHTTNVKHINLSYNYLQEASWQFLFWVGFFEEAFSNNIIDVTSTLDLSNNNFTLIDNNLFKGVLRIQNILLNNNNIKKISPYAFRDLLYVDLLDLRNNNLKMLPQEVLKILQKTEVIKLENNPWQMDFICQYQKWCNSHNKTNTMEMNCESV